MRNDALMHREGLKLATSPPKKIARSTRTAAPPPTSLQEILQILQILKSIMVASQQYLYLS